MHVSGSATAAEAAVTAAPEAIYIPIRSLATMGDQDSLLTVPGIALTLASAQRHIVAMDDLFLYGFPPHTGQAVQELACQLHPALSGNAP
jgi:iron complex transport system substrate-binding protein